MMVMLIGKDELTVDELTLMMLVGIVNWTVVLADTADAPETENQVAFDEIKADDPV